MHGQNHIKSDEYLCSMFTEILYTSFWFLWKSLEDISFSDCECMWQVLRPRNRWEWKNYVLVMLVAWTFTK